jgi:hypothetical protein
VPGGQGGGLEHSPALHEEDRSTEGRPRGITLGALIEDALRTYFAATDRKVSRPFRLHTVRGRLVNPALDLDRTSALLTSDDAREYAKARR